jgi:hypothetical protein
VVPRWVEHRGCADLTAIGAIGAFWRFSVDTPKLARSMTAFVAAPQIGFG